MSRRRTLSAEDKALWEAVRRTVNPLLPQKHAPASQQEPEPLPMPPPVPETPPPAQPVAPQKPPKAHVRGHPAAPYYPPVSKQKPRSTAISAPLPPPPDIDRKTRRSIARGSVPIEARLDLHGLTQDQAHGQLQRFLAMAQAGGLRVVLVITGKGSGVEVYRHPEPQRGVLRSVVPHWLELPEFRRFVVSWEQSHFAHGGEGAIYILVRKVKTHSLKT